MRSIIPSTKLSESSKLRMSKSIVPHNRKNLDLGPSGVPDLSRRQPADRIDLAGGLHSIDKSIVEKTKEIDPQKGMEPEGHEGQSVAAIMLPALHSPPPVAIVSPDALNQAEVPFVRKPQMARCSRGSRKKSGLSRAETATQRTVTTTLTAADTSIDTADTSKPSTKDLDDAQTSTLLSQPLEKFFGPPKALSCLDGNFSAVKKPLKEHVRSGGQPFPGSLKRKSVPKELQAVNMSSDDELSKSKISGASSSDIQTKKTSVDDALAFTVAVAETGTTRTSEDFRHSPTLAENLQRTEDRQEKIDPDYHPTSKESSSHDKKSKHLASRSAKRRTQAVQKPSSAKPTPSSAASENLPAETPPQKKRKVTTAVNDANSNKGRVLQLSDGAEIQPVIEPAGKSTRVAAPTTKKTRQVGAKAPRTSAAASRSSTATAKTRKASTATDSNPSTQANDCGDSQQEVPQNRSLPELMQFYSSKNPPEDFLYSGLLEALTQTHQARDGSVVSKEDTKVQLQPPVSLSTEPLAECRAEKLAQLPDTTQSYMLEDEEDENDECIVRLKLEEVQLKIQLAKITKRKTRA
jgi:hypothetical protein